MRPKVDCFILFCRLCKGYGLGANGTCWNCVILLGFGVDGKVWDAVRGLVATVGG